MSEHEPELVGYALGELSPAEAARVARHLEACPECRTTLRNIEASLGWLGTVVPQTEPPAGLRARVLAAAAGDDRRRWRSAWARGLLAAAAGLLVIALVLAVTRADRRVDELASRQAVVAAVLAEADWSTAMRGEAPGLPSVVGRVYLDREGERAVVALEKMPPPERGTVYQLWLVRSDGQRENGGVFVPDAAGRVLLVVEAQASWSAYQGMGITMEPAPEGSPQPTGRRVAGCSWKWEAWRSG
ncbi:anti-sigma factor [Thermomicrobium sp. 4228-Ro]|uniref:anti-sigma factor n=1 Tax=Thermomicrobium sp. 4228-Ro TaxID=2993937 RepID=UPI0022490245|nr:anti-sigma factor [Thermomicrobium sp. 4228-Ro]MCX2728325.1 anti-sigma factor [Thermomicrobium sp. 4228-Ro]